MFFIFSKWVPLLFLKIDKPSSLYNPILLLLLISVMKKSFKYYVAKKYQQVPLRLRKGAIASNCPLDGKCLIPNIVYKAQVTSSHLNYKQNIYIGTVEANFKHMFNNHTKSFNLEHHENDTKLSKKYWTIKHNHFTAKVICWIIRKCASFNTTRRKYCLCFNEKLELARYKDDNLLNKRSELISKCRHQNKLTALRHNYKD